MSETTTAQPAVEKTADEAAMRLVNECLPANCAIHSYRIAVEIQRAINIEREKIFIPNLDTAIRMVGAQIHHRGKNYIEIAVDPKTKQVAWSFVATLQQSAS